MKDNQVEKDIVIQEFEAQKAIASKFLGFEFEKMTSYPLHAVIARIVQLYGVTKEAMNNPDFDALAHYIDDFQNGYFNGYKDYNEYFNELVIKEKINLKLFNAKAFFKLLIDLAFFKYMTRKKARSLAIMQQYNEVIDSVLEINFIRLFNTVKYTQKDLDSMTSITLHGPKSGNIYLSPRVLDALKADQQEDQKYVDFAMRFFEIDEESARLMIYEFLSSSTYLLKLRKSIGSSFVFTLFKYAYYATRNDLQSKPSKAQAYRFVFDAIQPLYPQLLTPKKYMKDKNHSAFDKRSYNTYVADTIKSLAKM